MVILRRQENQNTTKKSFIEEFSQKNIYGSEYSVGFAVDIGTTTIAIYAIDFAKGTMIGSLSEINQQTTLGADVMMRIMHAVSGKAEQLHQMVVAQVEQMAAEILSSRQINLSDSSKVCFCVVGNTTMCHLFLGKDVTGLAGYPFSPAYQGSEECHGKELGMKRFRDSKVKVLAGIAGHVGSDALAVIGAKSLFQAGKIQLAIDLGTNAEIILNKKGKVFVCSTAAGPAFEGKGICCGMAAKPGAVNGVRILKNGNIVLDVIDSVEPSGICGSGLVDLLAQLAGCGIIQKDGYLLSKEEAQEAGVLPELCSQLAKRDEKNAFVLYSGGKGKKEVFLTQQDIRNLQLAKSAIQAGVQCLLQTGGVTLEETDEIIIAGVLGSCLHPANAVQIGLLPKADGDKMCFAGNAAGQGAVAVMLDEKFAEKLEKLARKIQHIELAQEPDFQEKLLNAMNFEGWF